MVVLRLVLADMCPLPSAATPLEGIAEVVEASDAYRAWPLLVASLRACWSWATLLCSKSRRATLVRPVCCGRLCACPLGRAVVGCDRCGRSTDLREVDEERTTAGDVGAAVDMAAVHCAYWTRRKEQKRACEESDAPSAVDSSESGGAGGADGAKTTCLCHVGAMKRKLPKASRAIAWLRGRCTGGVAMVQMSRNLARHSVLGGQQQGRLMQVHWGGIERPAMRYDEGTGNVSGRISYAVVVVVHSAVAPEL